MLEVQHEHFPKLDSEPTMSRGDDAYCTHSARIDSSVIAFDLDSSRLEKRLSSYQAILSVSFHLFAEFG